MVRATNFILTLGRAENKYKKHSKLMVAQRLKNKNNIFGISVLFYTGKSFIKLLLYFKFLFIKRAVNTLVVLILNHLWIILSKSVFLGFRLIKRCFKDFSDQQTLQFFKKTTYFL